MLTTTKSKVPVASEKPRTIRKEQRNAERLNSIITIFRWIPFLSIASVRRAEIIYSDSSLTRGGHGRERGPGEGGAERTICIRERVSTFRRKLIGFYVYSVS